jgi:large subunit ribosomal protein L13
MLPFKIARGREAYKRVMCYAGIPETFKNAELMKIPEAHIDKSNAERYMSIGEICKLLGGKNG